MNILYLKALHIIFVVTWFAGLFYIVRLFVYHAEANRKKEPDRGILISHFKVAEKRLWYGITWPSAVLTWISGLSLAISTYGTSFPSWLWLKLSFVILLTVYHFICQKIILDFSRDKVSWTGMQLRMWNEGATLFLVSIVFIVVLKNLQGWTYGVMGLLVFAGVLIAAIRIYKSFRDRNA